MVIDLTLSDEISDLYLDLTDIAFRVGKLPDSALMARRIGRARRRSLAAPDRLAHNGTPQTPEGLARHNCLGFNFRRANRV
ncbi:LysR substrate-binding domain-containing protein [Paracoccus litorisediminis]|uniref:LysR substrate-binding domain-containing protein n=1 Tax=Paracoccus litorisediminis TaxID=2006130 RepID=UPI0031B5DE4A